MIMNAQKRREKAQVSQSLVEKMTGSAIEVTGKALAFPSDMWMGGLVPLGYKVRDRQLVNQPVRGGDVSTNLPALLRTRQRSTSQGGNSIETGFDRKSAFAKNRSQSGGHSFSRGALYTSLGNPIYVGELRHKGTRHPGQHQPIVERAVWDKTDELLHAHAARARGKTSKSMSSPLVGKLFDESGEGLTPMSVKPSVLVASTSATI